MTTDGGFGRVGFRRTAVRNGWGFLVAALAIVLATVVVAAPVGAQGSGVECAEPVASYRYEPEAFVYSLAIDLSACPWWSGSSIALGGSASRLDATGERGSVVGVLCFRAAPSGAPAPRVTNCEVSVAVEHVSLEVARYTGVVTYPWEDGERRQSVELDCSSTPLSSLSGCRPALVPLQE